MKDVTGCEIKAGDWVVSYEPEIGLEFGLVREPSAAYSGAPLVTFLRDSHQVDLFCGWSRNILVVDRGRVPTDVANQIAAK